MSPVIGFKVGSQGSGFGMYNTSLFSSFLKYTQFPIVVNRRPRRSRATHSANGYRNPRKPRCCAAKLTEGKNKRSDCTDGQQIRDTDSYRQAKNRRSII